MIHANIVIPAGAGISCRKGALRRPAAPALAGLTARGTAA